VTVGIVWWLPKWKQGDLPFRRNPRQRLHLANKRISRTAEFQYKFGSHNWHSIPCLDRLRRGKTLGITTLLHDRLQSQFENLAACLLLSQGSTAFFGGIKVAISKKHSFLLSPSDGSPQLAGRFVLTSFSLYKGQYVNSNGEVVV
jgi:hypothetical protein